MADADEDERLELTDDEDGGREELNGVEEDELLELIDDDRVGVEDDEEAGLGDELLEDGCVVTG